jgi:hypothetical protein
MVLKAMADFGYLQYCHTLEEPGQTADQIAGRKPPV